LKFFSIRFTAYFVDLLLLHLKVILLLSGKLRLFSF